MGYIGPGEIFENMLQLTRISVYLEGILNINNGYFHIQIMISAARMLKAVRGNVLLRIFLKKMVKFGYKKSRINNKRTKARTGYNL